jgi:pimeloyl-ACP methyl ester carboxylesterase
MESMSVKRMEGAERLKGEVAGRDGMPQVSERRINVGEFDVNFATAGKGETVLMLHGSDHREDWHVWEPMLPLANFYSLVIPDLVGYGRSSRTVETPDHRVQARVMRDMLENLSVSRVNLVGSGWGGQVALELALQWRETVRAIVVIAGTYDKEQLPRLAKLNRPTMIIHAEDDMVTQLKAAYLLRDAIRTSRLEILEPVARDPTYDFTISHKLERFRAGEVLNLIRTFLTNPEAMISEPPEMERELRGVALRGEEKDSGR